MSIYDVINHRIGEGRLFPMTHRLGFPPVRHILASKEIYELVQAGPWQSTQWRSRGSALGADLDRFIDGSLINVALPSNAKPYRRTPSAYLRLLHKWADEVWEIRSVTASPSLRVFGRFADIDLFVALTWDTRARLATPPWRNAQISCKAEWTKLLYPYPAITGVNLNDYISTNAVSV